MATECKGHGLPFGAPASGEPYWVKRCAHLRDCFVVEFRNGPDLPYMIDYVQLLPNDDLIVESTGPVTEEAVTEAWDDMVARMIKGQPPEKERW